MEQEEFSFEKFFTERLRQKGITIKKIAEMTGISRSHIENIASGNFRDMPSAPYFHGYLVRLGKVLDFDGEEWWEMISKEGSLKKSGPKDTLPKNRFTQKYPTKFIWIGIICVIIIISFILQFARISGKPSVALIFPRENPYIASSTEITLQGIVTNADSISINGDSASINSEGLWQKNVLLYDGDNSFSISAKKFLGGESNIVEHVFYESIHAAPITTPTLEAPKNTSSSL